MTTPVDNTSATTYGPWIVKDRGYGLILYHRPFFLIRDVIEHGVVTSRETYRKRDKDLRNRVISRFATKAAAQKRADELNAKCTP